MAIDYGTGALVMDMQETTKVSDLSWFGYNGNGCRRPDASRLSAAKNAWIQLAERCGGQTSEVRCAQATSPTLCAGSHSRVTGIHTPPRHRRSAKWREDSLLHKVEEYKAIRMNLLL